MYHDKQVSAVSPIYPLPCCAKILLRLSWKVSSYIRIPYGVPHYSLLLRGLQIFRAFFLRKIQGRHLSRAVQFRPKEMFTKTSSKSSEECFSESSENFFAASSKDLKVRRPLYSTQYGGIFSFFILGYNCI